ncbi:MAG: copper resistance protein B [Hyphomonas sp.]|uniref:copper resistance protein B n=1 Tax=Hyphomonas sp. TaxID=87 RepID=UPI00179425A5|nr:copper resistance protein B [Hyphomonas sp.]MBA3070183.1 copper resistance protein B [Hyphomonas sp.]MBU3922154.1 copper resistance protein B [Alphaproteobacteria bacterium]MBU4060241.1 copper resistance protein B [Alphaproteobacteria bacterium]MBU4162909.1 copper resistance protein B [Alphaproteobacteria bacterium]
MNRTHYLAAFLVLSLGMAGYAKAQDAPIPGSQAEAYWDKDAFKASQDALKEEHGGGSTLFLLADRFEYQTNEGLPALFLGGQGWWGTDENRLWIKSEIDYDLDAGRFEDAEIQTLWSRPIARYFDVQAGLRHDFKPGPSRTYAVLGVQGLAPYWFEVDGAVFLSEKGDLSGRLEAEYEFRLTQRLILQPRAELNLAAQDVPELETGAGISTAEAGLRLRYEIDRQFAPYVGVNWKTSAGETANYIRARGDDTESLSFVTGIRLWF